MVNEKYFKKPILITGLPRSGTSLAAGILSLCGVWSGTTVTGTKDNIKGFYEHVGLREHVNKELLRRLKCDPLGVQRLPPVEGLPPSDNFKNVVLNIIQSDGYDGKKPWMFKDAKMLLLWPYYKQHFPNASWVIVRRSREEVIDSCLRTGFMRQHTESAEFWNVWASEYEKRIELLKESGVKYYEIWASDLFDPNSRDTLRNLVRKLKLKWNEHKVGEFIEPKVWHGNKAKKSS